MFRVAGVPAAGGRAQHHPARAVLPVPAPRPLHRRQGPRAGGAHIISGYHPTLANPSHKPKDGKSEIFGFLFFAT